MNTLRTREIGQNAFFSNLSDRVVDLENKGKLLEARQAADEGVEVARNAYDSPSFGEDELVMALEVRGGFASREGRVADARIDFEEAFRISKEQPDGAVAMGQMKMQLANLSESEGQLEDAIELYQDAIGHFKNAGENAQEEVAHLQNNLAFLYEATGNSDQAETLFLDGLKFFYEKYGTNHIDTASVCNNVGNLYYKLGHHEQAREMHLMSLEARKTILAKGHFDIAQSHANLALVLMSEGDSVAAKKNFEEALQAFDKLLPDSLDDFESVAANMQYFLNNDGHPKEAEALKKRTAKRLTKFQ